MKIKLDENLSQRLREVLVKLKHDVDTVVDEDLAGVDDVDILKKAFVENRILFNARHRLSESKNLSSGRS